jgi:hypothetical protein
MPLAVMFGGISVGMFSPSGVDVNVSSALGVVSAGVRVGPVVTVVVCKVGVDPGLCPATGSHY